MTVARLAERAGITPLRSEDMTQAVRTAPRVRLAASVIIRNELDRYLEPCLASLLEFCDEIRVLDDGSTDGWEETLRDPRIRVLRREGSERETGKDFRTHADARNQLLRFTLSGDASYVLAIDADEFVTDGAAVRRACAAGGVASSLTMTEVWEADAEGLCVRQDGGWRTHEVTMLWHRSAVGASSAIRDLGPATGRTPQVVSGLRARPTGSAVLHFGWAAESERATRYEKYMKADGGKFHALAHLQSIMWPCEKVSLEPLDWPAGLVRYREAILARANA